MPVYPKKGSPGKWRVKIWAQGRWLERLIEGKKAEATAYEARWRAELEVGRAPADPRAVQTFTDFCARRYRLHAEMHLRRSTWKIRRYNLATLATTKLDPSGTTLGATRMTKLSTEMIEKYKAARIRDGMEPSSVNSELRALGAVRTYARTVKAPIADFVIVQLPERGRGRVKFWTETQVAALYTSLEVESPLLLPAVVFLANTGCRKGEALAAERDWIDLAARLIRIPVNEFWRPKDNEPREVPISDALMPWLQRALAHGGRWLFPATRGEHRRHVIWPYEQFDRARKAAGLQGGPHTLRHTFASHFLRSVPDLFLLAQVLGHSHTSTTKLYAHLLPDHLERARNAVNLAPGIGAAALEAQRRWGGRSRG